MPYALVIIFFLFFFLAIILIGNKKKKAKDIRYIIDQWGNFKTEDFDFINIEVYANNNPDKYYHKLSAQTINDTDFQELFTFIDRTTSKTGQQFLYDKLLKPTNHIEELKCLDEKIFYFAENKAIREDIQLLTLSHQDAYQVAHLLKNDIFKKPKYYNLLVVDTVLVLLLIGFSFKFPVLSIALLVLLAVNSFFHFRNKNNTLQFMRAFPQLSRLINVAKALLQKDIPFDSKDIIESANSLSAFQKKIRILGFKKARVTDDLAQILFMVIDIIKAALLIEIHVFFSVVKDLENKQSHIHRLFRYVGLVDTAISIASLRAGVLHTCQPQFTETNEGIDIRNGIHPLVADCVPNDISVTLKSIIVTGSNMSGKTTFLRMVCVNAILAQTIYTCFAECYKAPLIKVFTSIRIDDNLLEGKSYFFEEAKVVQNLIREASSGEVDLFVLDEMFRGTNTVERIAAAKAVLSYLQQHDNIVIAATHDLELVSLLNNEFELFYFSESIEDHNIHFDFKMKPGILKTKNAIKILGVLRFPAQIVDDANMIAAKLLHERSFKNSI